METRTYDIAADMNSAVVQPPKYSIHNKQKRGELSAQVEFEFG